jgi:hypothetical protein
MSGKSIHLAFLVFGLGLLLCAVGSAADPALVAWWRLDETSGTTAHDATVHGNDGTLRGDPTWVAGMIGGALQFDGDGDYVDIGGVGIGGMDPRTLMGWVKADTTDIANWTGVFGFTPDGTTDGTYFDIEVDGGNYVVHVGGWDSVFGPVDLQWHHFAVTYDGAGGNWYMDGQYIDSLDGAVGTIDHVRIGARPSNSNHFPGLVDDVRIYNKVLTDVEILRAMQGKEKGLAADPSPPADANDVLRDVVLTWTAGEFAAKHNVYFGSNLNDVESASTANPLDVLLAQAQNGNSLDVGTLDLGQSYYWRVDEVNGAPDFHVYKGEVWSFTVEATSRPITQVTATASSHAPDMGPEKTIDGSGLNALGQHSTRETTMWLSANEGSGAWIQYEFDKAYKLHALRVWNSNQMVEGFLGLGVKDVNIEVSVDGTDWQVLEAVPQFVQAPGEANYVANTAVDFAGVMAQYVKITVDSGYGILPQYGLSEVRFFAIPTYAWQAEPAPDVITDGADVLLQWRAGREAVSHEVSFGTDSAAVINDAAVVGSTAENSFDPGLLDYGTTYYWKVSEINEAATPPAYAGDIWSFTTSDFGVVDDFDQYDDHCNRVFFTWQDGLGHSGGEDILDCTVAPSSGNGGGSAVGHNQAPFAENRIVTAGSTQSLPMSYDNSFGPSEITLSLNGQDWTLRQVQTLSIAFRGVADNSGTLYAKINNSKVVYDGDPADLAREAWQNWNIDLTALPGLENVTSLTIGVDGAGAKGMLYLDDIRLYPVPAELIPPAEGPGE